uniref:Uncharacterized protein n=1 Tax=Picea sitchensis TaxID=3332 RepID=A9NZ17_PICSI|nr:unknown [Picea sitchensis]
MAPQRSSLLALPLLPMLSIRAVIRITTSKSPTANI